MDNRISEVEQMIADCNNHALLKKQLSLKTAEDWRILLETIQKIQKAVAEKLAEGKETVAPKRVSDLVCSKCGTPLKTGVKFCRNCGVRADIPLADLQPALAGVCACGAKIVEGAKFCRECGKPRTSI